MANRRFDPAEVLKDLLRPLGKARQAAKRGRPKVSAGQRRRFSKAQKSLGFPGGFSPKVFKPKGKSSSKGRAKR